MPSHSTRCNSTKYGSSVFHVRYLNRFVKAELEIVLQFWADTKSCAIHRRQRCQELYNEVVSIEEEEEEEEEQIKKEINKKHTSTRNICVAQPMEQMMRR